MPSLSEEQLAEKVQQLLFDEPYPLEPLLELFHQYGVSEKDEVLGELLSWYHFWESTHKEPFNWYGAVKALKVAKDHRKPFTELTQSDSREGGENG